MAASVPPCCFFCYAVHQTLSLYSDIPLSSRLQPLGSGGDVTPCEDTREDFGLSLNFLHRVLLQGGLKKLVRCIPERPGREPACVVDRGGSVVTSAVTSPNPEWGNSAGELA